VGAVFSQDRQKEFFVKLKQVQSEYRKEGYEGIDL